MKKISVLLSLITFIHWSTLYGQLNSIDAKTSAGGKASNVVLSGKITDAISGLPITGANVFIPDIRVGAVADNNGVYKTIPIPSGTYVVEISSVGYKSISENI